MKLRVLHVLNSSSFSGAENVVIHIIKNTMDEVLSAYASPDGTIGSVLAEENIKFYPVESKSVYQLGRIIKEFKPDIIHAHDFTASIISSIAFSNKPVISHLHNNALWLKKAGLFSTAYLLSSFFYRKILTVSSSVVDDYIFKRFIRKKAVVISNPVDSKEIRKKADCRDNCNKEFDLVFVGRLTPEKDPLRFIELVSKLKDHIPNCRAVMVGNGVLYDECLKQISNLNLENTIVLTGFLTNPFNVMSKSKVLCLTSRWEGFGLVAFEALALGIPVLATDVGGLKDIVNSDCGLLYREDDDFIEECKRLLTDGEYWKMKSDAASKHAKILDNIEDYKKRILDIYNEVI